jgi:nucleotide-binding universal stress UspA family protein
LPSSARCDSTGIEYLLADGIPAEEIVKVASDRGCDLIVMGTHGRTGVGRLLLGSVAEEVMRKAPCPVLTLKHPLPAAEAEIAPVKEPALA